VLDIVPVPIWTLMEIESRNTSQKMITVAPGNNILQCSYFLKMKINSDPKNSIFWINLRIYNYCDSYKKQGRLRRLDILYNSILLCHG
jgi:hypothetical protein